MTENFFQLIIKICFALVAILILIPLSVGLGIKYVDYIPFLNEIPGNNGDWLGFWSGYLGSIIGVGGAYYVMRHQLKTENNKELKDKKTLLVPGSTEYTNLILTPGKDMIKDGKWFRELNEFSETSFPIINGGITPAFDIKYYYTIKNFEEYKIKFKVESMDTDIRPRMFIEQKNEADVINYYYEEADDKGNLGPAQIRKKNLPYLNVVPVIMPGESVNVNLPATAILLLSHMFYIANSTPPYRPIRTFLPELSICLRYKDYELVDREVEFDLYIENYSTKKDDAEFRIAQKPKDL